MTNVFCTMGHSIILTRTPGITDQTWHNKVAMAAVTVKVSPLSFSNTRHVCPQDEVQCTKEKITADDRIISTGRFPLTVYSMMILFNQHPHLVKKVRGTIVIWIVVI